MNTGRPGRIPPFVTMVLDRLHRAGFQAYVVGGAVRDMVMGRPIRDWDVVTSGGTEDIERVFHDVSLFSLKHDTITLVQNKIHYEVTPYRTREGDGRGLERDLGLRDFTINAMAYDPGTDRIIDPCGGREDVSRKTVRAVGVPGDRFLEDPLRLVRAVRLAAELRFRIDPDTLEVMRAMARQIAGVSRERIRDELMKILMCPKPSTGFRLLQRTGLLDYFLPELVEGVGKRQNPAYHRFTIFRHIMETLDRTPPDPDLRLTALFHDIAKPRTRERIAGTYRFYGHEKEGAKLTAGIMERLKFSRERTNRVSHLTRHHIIGYRRDWGDAAIRRMIRRVGPENVAALIAFRRADLLAHGKGDASLELLEELESRIAGLGEGRTAVRVTDLAIDGNTVMRRLDLGPGPAVGRILDQLMECVTDHPAWNTRDKLLSLLEQMKEGRPCPSGAAQG